VALFYGEGTRTMIVAARFLAGPLTYAVLPLGIIHWRRIGWTGRSAWRGSVDYRKPCPSRAESPDGES